MIPRTLARLAASSSRLTARRVTTGAASRSKCEGGGRKRHPGHENGPQAKSLCQELKDNQCSGEKQKKPKKCEKDQMSFSKEEDCPELSEECSKRAAQECIQKIQALQKQWEAVVRHAERAQEAAQQAGARKKSGSCHVKAPKKEESPWRNLPIFLLFAAVAAGLGYYLYNEAQKNKDKDGEEGDKDKDKDGKEHY